MLYSGYSQGEIKRITDILEKHGATYELSAPEPDVKVPRDNSIMRIFIANEELAKVPAPDLHTLHDLRIFGELESPFTEEDFMEKPPSPTAVKKKAEMTKMNQVAALLAIGLVVMGLLYRSGFFR